MRKQAKAFTGLLSGLSLGIASYACLGRVSGTQTLHYLLAVEQFDLTAWAASAAVGALLLFLLESRFLRAEQAHGEQAGGGKFRAAVWPLLTLLPIGLVQPEFPSLLFYVAVVSIVCYRLMAVWPGPSPFERLVLPRYAAWGLLSTFMAWSIVYAYLLQSRSYDALYLAWDWEAYFNTVDNTLKGNWFYCDLIGRNYLGQHFSPSIALILGPFIWLCRTVQTLFAVNAVFLYIGAIGLYALARAKQLGRGESLALSAIYILHPSLSSIATCLFYGFHDTNLAIPLVIFFFLALEKGWRKSAIALFLLTLLLKETVAIFWAFTGLAIAIERPRRKLGLAIAIGSAAYFLLTLKVIMPLFTNGVQYEFIGIYYGNLGNSITEIALSPIMKPGVFWGQLFRVTNLYFLALFMLPALITSVNRPRYFIGFIGILAFTFAKDSNETCTINSSYQSEILALLYVAAAYGLAKLAGFDGDASQKAPLAGGLGDAGRPSRKLAHAALAASLLAAALCYQLFALGCPFGKNIWAKTRIDSSLDFTPDLKRWQAYIPQGSTLAASTAIGAHFLTRNTVHSLEFQPNCEYVLLDLNDGIDGKIEDYRRRLILSGRYSLVQFENVKRHAWLLFKREEPAAPLPKAVFKSSETQWERAGEILAENEFASAKIFLPPPEAKLAPPGSKAAMLLFRLKAKPDCDLVFDFTIKARETGMMPAPFLRIPFAHGILPAYMAEPGDCFQYATFLPEGEETELSLEIRNAIAPDPSKPPF